MTYVFLPHENNIWLHKLDSIKPNPVAKLPGGDDAKYFMSTDHSLFSFLDQAQKRIGLYQLLESEPWFEKKMSPVTLPKNCIGDDVLIHNAVIYVGGRSKTGEFLWQREINDQHWLPLAFPDNFSPKSGKSIDLLFLDGDRLIAVDDIFFPKWIFTYDISENELPKPVDIVSLEQHITLESVYGGADNENYIALLSAGANHGKSFKFVSLLDKKTLKEQWCWGANKLLKNPPLFASDIINPEQLMDVFCMFLKKSVNKKELLELTHEMRNEEIPALQALTHYMQHNALSYDSYFNSTNELELFTQSLKKELHNSRLNCRFNYTYTAETIDTPQKVKRIFLALQEQVDSFIATLTKNEDRLNSPKHIQSERIYGVVFLANYLLLATEDGLMCVDTAMANDGKALKKSDNVKWVFKVMPLKTLLCPFYFVTILESSSALFVVGKLTDQQLGYELITCQDLKQLCKDIIPEIASNLNGSI
ncbi:MAG: hypothetical protein RIQ94_1505 [Pseudomonadota bacterium]